ncbi:hypothetical protein SB48_HM08orf05665 [Heyndrickxia coagulans]|uniref:Uncharacterized protein n=1 Tax=Heyndrickxia coagulans TaxID=1398 RepID=A0AAN0WD58_HEYCO|nr:hypothetical protein SB48_HM08orf05665 [Heyndrickxia coagulans]
MANLTVCFDFLIKIFKNDLQFFRNGLSYIHNTRQALCDVPFPECVNKASRG